MVEAWQGNVMFRINWLECVGAEEFQIMIYLLVTDFLESDRVALNWAYKFREGLDDYPEEFLRISQKAYTAYMKCFGWPVGDYPTRNELVEFIAKEGNYYYPGYDWYRFLHDTLLGKEELDLEAYRLKKLALATRAK